MKIGIFGGGFKPFTSGHFSKLALAVAENDRVVLFYALQERKKGSDFLYTREMAAEVFEIMKIAIEREMPSVSVLEAKPNPLVFAFEAIAQFANVSESGKYFNWGQIGVNADEIEELTLYGDEETTNYYRSYVGTPKEQKYYGSTYQDGTLHFDTGIEDTGSDERIISAMRKYHPGSEDSELGTKSRVRGTEVRTTLPSRDEPAINRFLPPILNDKERTSVISILYRGLSERVLRSTIRSMIFTG